MKPLRWFRCSLCGAVELRKIAGSCTACLNGTMRFSAEVTARATVTAMRRLGDAGPPAEPKPEGFGS